MADRTEIEARLQKHPDDVETYLVYADLLQAEKDPRGELIVLQHNGKDEEARALIDQHADELLGELKNYTIALDGSNKPAFEWQLGFIRRAWLSYDSYARDYAKVPDGVDVTKLSLDEALEHLLTHPSGSLLQDLTVAINMLDDGGYFDPVCKAIAAHGAPRLRRLRLGEYNFAGPRGPEDSSYDYEISWTCFGNMESLWKAVPNLERLVIQGSVGHIGFPGDTSLGEIDLPRLKHLEIISGGLAQDNTQAIAGARWPELTHLDLWFGDEEYGFSGGVDDLTPLLEARDTPQMRHLGLMNATFADDLCRALPGSKILSQLDELSLALGMLTDEGARVLADNKAAFEHLKTLDLEYNYLTDAGIHLVSDLCADVRTGNQKDTEDDYRYVSVGE